MQQRQYRPGDVLDDYCPRERRVTDHAIVAMVDSEIQRTRCVVCDAEHEYKNARVPAPRKKGSTAALFNQVLDNIDAPPGRIAAPVPASAAEDPAPPDIEPAPPAAAAPDPAAAEETDPPPAQHEDRPFRRSLIRAQLPRYPRVHDAPAAEPAASPRWTTFPPPPGRTLGFCRSDAHGTPRRHAER